MKKNYNIIKEFRKWKLNFQQHFLLFDIYSTAKKEKYIQLIYNINRYYKKNRLSNKLKARINEIIYKFNLKFFNERWIIYDLDLFKNKNINNIYYPILLPEQDISKLNKLLHKQWLNFNKEEQAYINTINFQLSELYLNWVDELLDDLINLLKQEYDTIKDIIPNKKKDEWSIFLFIEKWRYYFVYIFKWKVYTFNIYLKDNKIILNKDSIYKNIYNKSFYIFNNFEFYKINKINKALVEKILCKFYKINKKQLYDNYEIKSIFKKDIINTIKNIY